MKDFEKLGVFYLGKAVAPAGGDAAAAGEPLLYDARDLTTHAVCVGMTGSGKTGLAVALLEEAAIDGIPALAIDPKGDLGNLLLTFPELRPDDFRPWIDTAEAARRGLTPETHAANTAEAWRRGLAEWGQDGARIARLRAAADIAVYTPGSTTGRPLSLLGTFAAPPAAAAADASARQDRIASIVSGLLGLAGIEADPVKSREHILLSRILDEAWSASRDLDLPSLIRATQKPPFNQVGVFDLETFYPARERLELSMALNNLLASPGFAAWTAGEPLDIQRLLYTPEGRPRLSILSIAHLDDAERMFFVTSFLGELVAWMRRQPGTSSLRALLYMDEIYGYFPPTANPPCKPPMLTLLKQARAFGLGVVLSTQNPVDLDYKGLSNAGTWFVGRLQTERDKNRVLDGLELAAAGDRPMARAELDAIISGLDKRVFLMRNVHDPHPVLFRTRWTLSYLRGPMTPAELAGLSRQPSAVPTPAAQPAVTRHDAPAAAPEPARERRPVLPPGIEESFLRPAQTPPVETVCYRPEVGGVARLHFVNAKAGVDEWRTVSLSVPAPETPAELSWSEASRHDEQTVVFERDPLSRAAFADVPPAAANARNYAGWSRSLSEFLYRNETLELYTASAIKLVSRPDETRGDFAARAAMACREQRDAEVDKLRAAYAPKVESLRQRIRRAEDRVEREQAQVGQQRMQTAISVGATILGALFGRRALGTGTLGRATTAMRGAGRIAREAQDVEHAAGELAALQARLRQLEQDLEADARAVAERLDPLGVTLESVAIRPRKSDISVARFGLVWIPWAPAVDGYPRPLVP